MKTFIASSLVGLSSSGSLLLAEAIPFEGWSKLGVVGILGAILAMLVLRILPSNQKACVDAIDKIEDRNNKRYMALVDQVEERLIIIQTKLGCPSDKLERRPAIPARKGKK